MFAVYGAGSARPEEHLDGSGLPTKGRVLPTEPEFFPSSLLGKPRRRLGSKLTEVLRPGRRASRDGHIDGPPHSGDPSERSRPIDRGAPRDLVAR